MGVINITFCVILLFHIVIFSCNGVHIDIDPTKTIATTVNDIHITCLPDGDEDNGKQLTLIELSRNDQDTIVFVSQCGKISFGHDSSNKFQATGHIDEVSGQSYLNVTLVNPESQDTGIYTCVMVYLNTEGHLETEKDSGNLLVENLDVKALEGVLNKMKDRIASLETEDKDLHEKVTALEKTNMNQSLEFAALKEKVSYNALFMATTQNQFTSSPGSVLVLPDIITAIGTGYDRKTGVFTSPVSGLYAFHVVATISSTKCNFNIELMANEKLLSKLYARDDSTWDQSSISSVTELKAGDRVFCKALNTCTVVDRQYTVFTGYLIKAF